MVPTEYVMTLRLHTALADIQDAITVKVSWRDSVLTTNFSREMIHFSLAVIQGRHICPHQMEDLAYTFHDHTCQNLIVITCDMQLYVASIHHVLQTMTAMMSSMGTVYMQNNTGLNTEPCGTPQ